jgi:hypothetical protein
MKECFGGNLEREGAAKAVLARLSGEKKSPFYSLNVFILPHK